MLNVLLITLGLAYLTELAGCRWPRRLPRRHADFETEYRYQVEEDIKPFRDALMGLFFVTIGMLLDVHLVLDNALAVLGVLVALLVLKGLVVGGCPACSVRRRERRSAPVCGCAPAANSVSCCIGRDQAAGSRAALASQAVLAALVLSMLIAPIIVNYADRIALRFAASEWLLRSMELTSILAQSMGTERHAIICGFGRSGQTPGPLHGAGGRHLHGPRPRPGTVREAAAAGENVVRRCGAARSPGRCRVAARQRVVVAIAESRAAEKILHLAHELKPDLPVVVRAPTTTRTWNACAPPVPPRWCRNRWKASMMLASHALVLIGIPINRVLKRVREMRASQYQLMRGFFHGQTDRDEDVHDSEAVRLHSVTLAPGAAPSAGRWASSISANWALPSAPCADRNMGRWSRRTICAFRATSSCSSVVRTGWRWRRSAC